MSKSERVKKGKSEKVIAISRQPAFSLFTFSLFRF